MWKSEIMFLRDVYTQCKNKKGKERVINEKLEIKNSFGTLQ